MSDSVYDRVNDYGSVKITLASPNDIRSWSFGEVKKPETINYRTYRPERDGLFCERIFGPERDYECGCGKYKGTKYKGIICDRCGVKVTHSRVRRKRMGHINLAAPVVHIWFFKAMPSRLGNLLAMKTSDLEKVVYFQDYVVTDPGDTDLKYQEVLEEAEYQVAREKYGNAFTAMMGAEAVRELLNRLDLDDLEIEIRQDLSETKSKQKQKELAKRLKIVTQIRGSENNPAWMVLDVVPVIPPDLRPLVLLESGNFATSDLNDLYRRIINRNNRLKKLMDLNAPEVIIRNEKRMLQQAVDALFDNGRCRRPVLGSSNRPLKSITDMIKGKQGRFRENLLGKRVDYSARSVIVVGPELKLHQCGLPKKIALELYQPFIIKKLKEHGLADTIKAAKRMLERRDPHVWDILEQVIRNHPVLLNRAPTLHRMGIQAFEPVLVEGNAIKIHPLVCTAYNADFDGDQMAVHLPLSVEAQTEAHVLMMSVHNIFSPANGNPIVSPSQDIVMGVYFLTVGPDDAPDEKKDPERYAKWRGKLRRFRHVHEAFMAQELGTVGIHDWIDVRAERFSEVVNSQTGRPEPMPESRRLVTTVGRLHFSEILPDGMPFYNCALGKKGAARVIDDTFARKGKAATIELLDRMKETGFRFSTISGLSFGITDLRIPEDKEKLIEAARKQVKKAHRSYDTGAITDGERRNQVLEAWSKCRADISDRLMETLKHDWRDAKSGREVPIPTPDTAPASARRYLNPVYLFADSGARGNKSQMQQLAGLRGLMAKPSGEIIETPINSNFREGLSVLEYFTSTHGTRKGLADTALKTADSGYLTRKLCDVAQSVVVTERDCGTRQGITKRAIYKGEDIDVPLREVIRGRTARQAIIDPRTDRVIVKENEVIDDSVARQIEALGIDTVQVRSPLKCETARGICAYCYGMDLAAGKLVEEGMAVGIIAAQSIGEPGTQLTMRTFHTGGIAFSSVADTTYLAQNNGSVELRDCNEVEVETDGVKLLTALKKTGEIAVRDDKGREVEKFKVPYGAIFEVRSGDKVKKGQQLMRWDPHRTPILAEKSGIVQFKDLDEGETVKVETKGSVRERIVTEHTGDLHPQIKVVDPVSGVVLDFHNIPAKARLEVEDGQQVRAGQMLAHTPKEAQRSADIVGGLPRVTEIFEARTPRDPAVLAKISGRVELLPERRKGKMTIRVTPPSGDADAEEHHVPQGKHLRVHTGDHVQAGDPLCEGPAIPADILQIKGEEALHAYMLEEIQNVYRAQGVPISDKHIEVILRQMLGKVRISDQGDTDALPLDVADKFAIVRKNEELKDRLVVEDSGETALQKGRIYTRDEVKEANAVAESNGKKPCKTRKPKPARYRTLLLGITKASLQAESFLSGASFQETTKVLTEAALKGAVDTLQGLKENVLLGHLIPAGTGFGQYPKIKVKPLVELPALDEATEAAMRADAASRAENLGAERIGMGTTVADMVAAQSVTSSASHSSDGGVGVAMETLGGDGEDFSLPHDSDEGDDGDDSESEERSGSFVDADDADDAGDADIGDSDSEEDDSEENA
ncbi:MAG: DNA-directed RNA polymerase subunit beta' [Phycisphaeraceae bacterium]|nr:DNA-directed RNA polymerase subunit beta' [Phycisphaeraceae bacterium]